MPRLSAGLFAAAPCAAVLLPAAVAAQNLPPDASIRFTRYIPVRERQQAGYETPGVPVGAFTLSPSAEVTANATDNVFALEDDGGSDAFVTLAPSARLTSNWTGRSLNLSADGTFSRFARNATENVNAVNVAAYATQDIKGRARVRLLARFRNNRESRESQNAFALTERPIAFNEMTGALGLSKQFGSVILAGEAGVQRSDFRDGTLRSGGLLEQDYRDGSVRTGRLRADVVQTASVAYFVQASHAASSFALRSDSGARRGANTTEVLAGARFELPILMRGEIGLGYITSSYRDERFRRFSGLAVNSQVAFFPTQLTTVTVNAVRSVNDAGTPDSSTYVALSGGVQVDHELLRSLILGAGVQLERDSYNGVARRDGRVNLTASADYRVNRNYSLRLSADRLDLSSTGAERYKSFSRDRILLGLSVRM